jgi:hypothetical protein
MAGHKAHEQRQKVRKAHVDPEAFNAPDGYWSTWVEEFGGD